MDRYFSGYGVEDFIEFSIDVVDGVLLQRFLGFGADQTCLVVVLLQGPAKTGQPHLLGQRLHRLAHVKDAVHGRAHRLRYVKHFSRRCFVQPFQFAAERVGVERRAAVDILRSKFKNQIKLDINP